MGSVKEEFLGFLVDEVAPLFTYTSAQEATAEELSTDLNTIVAVLVSVADWLEHHRDGGTLYKDNYARNCFMCKCCT